MEAAWAAECRLTPDAAEFVRFCYRRRKVGWPELYDEMCAVASRGLFRGWGPDELSAQGVGFGLFELPALAALVARIVSEEPPVGRERGRRAIRIADDGCADEPSPSVRREQVIDRRIEDVPVVQLRARFAPVAS